MDEERFWSTGDTVSKQTKIDKQIYAENGKVMVPIVDEKVGDIICYAHENQVDNIVQLLEENKDLEVRPLSV